MCQPRQPRQRRESREGGWKKEGASAGLCRSANSTERKLGRQGSQSAEQVKCHRERKRAHVETGRGRIKEEGRACPCGQRRAMTVAGDDDHDHDDHEVASASVGCTHASATRAARLQRHRWARDRRNWTGAWQTRQMRQRERTGRVQRRVARWTRPTASRRTLARTGRVHGRNVGGKPAPEWAA